MNEDNEVVDCSDGGGLFQRDGPLFSVNIDEGKSDIMEDESPWSDLRGSLHEDGSGKCSLLPHSKKVLGLGWDKNKNQTNYTAEGSFLPLIETTVKYSTFEPL